MTQKIFNDIGGEYATRFSSFHISKHNINEMQNDMVMSVRPSMLKEIEKCNLRGGLFIYSMWQGYRDSDYQHRFEDYLAQNEFRQESIHTSGHASVADIRKVITGLKSPKNNTHPYTITESF